MSDKKFELSQKYAQNLVEIKTKKKSLQCMAFGVIIVKIKSLMNQIIYCVKNV